MSADTILIPARRGRAIALDAGQRLKIINTHGSQVLDTWAFGRPDGGTWLSMEHTRSWNSRLTPRVGDVLVSNRYRPMLTVVEDTSPGIHDTLMCCCSRAIYEKMGCTGYHDNCEDNLHVALGEVAITLSHTPGPLNLFMNFPVASDGTIDRRPPPSKPGDYVVLEAMADLYVVLSACPQDRSPVNGEAMTPTEAHCRIL
jgi:hypothetical protein